MKQTLTARAAVLRTRGASFPYAQSRPLSIENVEIDPPGPGEVLVTIKAAGLCHSDLSVIDGNRPRPLPMVIGHEAAGIVSALGGGVDDLEIGDHVVMVFMPSCGHCLPCAKGRPALCEPGAAANGAGTLLGGGYRLHGGEGMLHHHLGCSAFAELAVVSRRSLVKVDRDLDFADAAMFGCAVLTGVGTVVNTAKVRLGETVAIVGLGGVGLSALLGAIASGAAQVIAVDPSEAKLALAKALGATAAVNANNVNLVEIVRRITDGGADYAFEFSGQGIALHNALAMTRRGGMTITGSLPSPDATVAVKIANLVAEERILKGSYIGSAVPARDIPRYISLFKSGRLPIDQLRSGIIGLDDLNSGFDQLQNGEAVRLVALL